MQIDLYTALVKIKVSEEDARKVVEALQQHIDMQISQATQPLLSKLDAVQGSLSAQIAAFAQIKTQTETDRERRAQLTRWVIGTSVAAVAATLGVLRAFGVI